MPITSQLYSDSENSHLKQPFTDLATQPIFQDTTKVSLILSSPRNLTDQTKRSYLYGFDHEFKNIVQDTVIRATTYGENSRTASLLPPTPPMLNAIVPNANGLPIQTSQFSEFWSYYLILDNIPYNYNKTLSIAGLQSINRLVISGFCSLEPINPVNHGKLSLNFECFLTPTHFTYFRLRSQGSETVPLIDFYVDEDILHNTSLVNIMKNLPSDESLNFLRPYDYTVVTNSNSEDIYGDQSYQYYDNKSILSADNKIVPINTSLHVPRIHIANIVNAAITSANVSTSIVISPDNKQTIGNVDNYIDAFDHHLKLKNDTVSYQFIFNPIQPIMLHELLRIFPRTNVIPLFIPKEATWNVISQADITMSNVYSSVIASSIPPIMTRFNLSEVMFRYASWTNNPDGSQGTYQVKHLATYIQVPNTMISKSWQAFTHALETEIFPLLLQKIGHFDIFISCQSMGYVHIDLHALDFSSQYQNGIYETYNFLGGINTPLVGLSAHFDQNSAELSNLINQVGEGLDHLASQHQSEEYPLLTNQYLEYPKI